MISKFLTLCVCRVSNNECVVGPNDGYLNTSMPFDDRFMTCSSELLSCITTMFNWAPIHEDIKLFNSEFFNNLYELTFYNETFVNINIAALMTISELFYLQKPLPLLQIQANGIMELIQQQILPSSCEEYQDKLTELLKLFITQQWNRCIISQDFPANDFLLHLFNYTFAAQQTSALTFAERVTLWKTILKSFNEKGVGRYTETLLQLILNVYRKLQFHYDHDLDLLDSEDVDENMQTELQSYQNQCMDIICVAVEIEPVKVFDLINNDFLLRDDSRLNHFFAILHTIPDDIPDTIKSPLKIEELIRSQQELTKSSYFFHFLVRDVSTILQTMTRVLSCNELLACTERATSTIVTMRNFIHAFKLANQKKLHLYNFDDQPQIANDLIDLQTQYLTSLRTIVLLRREICEDRVEMSQLVEGACGVIMDKREPLIMKTAAVGFLVTFSMGFRGAYILENPLFSKLFYDNVNHHSNSTLRINVKNFILNVLLLPYNKIAVNATEEQEYAKRGKLAIEYIESTSSRFLLTPQDDELKILEKIDHLSDCADILNFYETSNTTTKQMLLAAMQKVINRSIEIFLRFGKNPKIFELTAVFFHSVVRCLSHQLGNEFIIKLINMLLEMASAGNGTNSQVLNTLLQILIFIVQVPTQCPLIKDILKLSLDDLSLEKSLSLDLCFNLYTLFDKILQNHWSFFHKIIDGRNSENDLLKILTAYGQYLCNETSNYDPNVTIVILNSLEKLNEVWKLYEKTFFKSFLLKSFIVTLVRLLIGGTLFQEKVSAILYAMTINEKLILQECLMSIGCTVEQVKGICSACDLPTFLLSLDILIQDAAFLQSQ